MKSRDIEVRENWVNVKNQNVKSIIKYAAEYTKEK